MNKLDYIVLDTETTGTDPKQHEVIELCARAYDGRTLQPVPASQGGAFHSLLRPLRPETATEAAMRVNKLDLEELKKAPDPRVVWPQFVTWVKTRNKGKGAHGCPILVGKNVAFDLAFLERALADYARKGGKSPMLFHRNRLVEVQHLLFFWFENTDELADYRMDTCRDFFGLSREGAHRAEKDVEQTGALAMYFLGLHRRLRQLVGKDGRPFINFKGCLEGL